MSHLNVSRNVYLTVTTAAHDGQIGPTEIQQIVQEFNGDHQINPDELRLLKHLQKGTPFTLHAEGQSIQIKAQQLMVPKQQSFISEQDAQRYARAQGRVLGNVPDLAILQNTVGRYQNGRKKQYHGCH